jgi:hypothetical protein
VTDQPPIETESGLPRQQGEFAISLPWIARVVLAMAIGAAIGFAAGSLLTPLLANRASLPVIVAAGAVAAILFSFRKVHGWHVSTFVDGTIVGIAAAPMFLILVFVYATPLAEARFTWAQSGHVLTALVYSFFAVPITLPCGWWAGFAYHLLLSAVERRRVEKDDTGSA